jgi:hypothetical protein
MSDIVSRKERSDKGMKRGPGKKRPQFLVQNMYDEGNSFDNINLQNSAMLKRYINKMDKPDENIKIVVLRSKGTREARTSPATAKEIAAREIKKQKMTKAKQEYAAYLQQTGKKTDGKEWKKIFKENMKK